MTAATATRSAYPRAVEDLIPHARDLAEQLGETPSRNLLMKTFHIGDKKANALIAELAPAPTALPVADPEPVETPPAAPAAPNLVPLIGPADEMRRFLEEAGGPGRALLTALTPAPAPPTAPKPVETEPTADPVLPVEPVAEPSVTPPPLPPIDPTDEMAWVGIARPAAEPVGPPFGEGGVQVEPPAAGPVAAPERAPSRLTRYGMAALLTVVGVLLAGVIIAPIALSSQDIIAWAGSPTGLGLTGAWPTVTFLALDAAAAVCVGLVVYCAWRGESAGAFAWLVWAFAGMSAYANYSHSSGSAARDAVWFFPAMSIAGPFLLEIIVRRVRRWVQEGTGQRAKHSVSFGFARWVPGVGALRETYGAWRLARLDGISDAREAVTTYRRLCPDGSVRVLRALRDRDRTN